MVLGEDDPALTLREALREALWVDGGEDVVGVVRGGESGYIMDIRLLC